MMIRIKPLQPPYADQTEAILRKWMPPGSSVEPLALFRTLAVHEDLASRMRPLGSGLLGAGTVAPLLREVLIHRTCARCDAEYEWGVHAAAFGRPLGLTDEQLRSTVHGDGDDPCWDGAQRAVMRLADELHETSGASDALFEELSIHFDAPQILELAVTVGWYHTIAFVLGVAGVERESWAERFPTRA